MRYASCFYIFNKKICALSILNQWVKFLIELQLAMAKDPEAAFFKRLEGLQPCEVSELKAGTHIFAVYGALVFL